MDSHLSPVKRREGPPVGRVWREWLADQDKCSNNIVCNAIETVLPLIDLGKSWGDVPLMCPGWGCC